MRGVSTPRLLGWQVAIAAAVAAVAAATGIGSPAGIAFGAALVAASLLLQIWATRTAFRGTGNPGIAVAILTLKLGLLLGAAALGLAVTGLPPMSFAAGATTLLLAIVVETCYADWSSRRSSG